MASANGNIEVLKYLKEKIPDEFKEMINFKNSFGNTPLHWATLNQQKECLEFLLGENADTQLLNEDKQTALDIAIET